MLHFRHAPHPHGESLDIEDIDPATMAIFNLQVAPAVTNTGDPDWLCGHCEETLLHRASDGTNDGVVFRCPHCFRFSRFRQAQ